MTVGHNHAEELRQLAQLTRRLTPDRHDPELYFLTKDQIAKRLMRLARQVEANRSE